MIYDHVRFRPNSSDHLAMEKDIADVQSLDDLPPIVAEIVRKVHRKYPGAGPIELVRTETVEDDKPGMVSVLTRWEEAT